MEKNETTASKNHARDGPCRGSRRTATREAREACAAARWGETAGMCADLRVQVRMESMDAEEASSK